MNIKKILSVILTCALVVGTLSTLNVASAKTIKTPKKYFSLKSEQECSISITIKIPKAKKIQYRFAKKASFKGAVVRKSKYRNNKKATFVLPSLKGGTKYYFSIRYMQSNGKWTKWSDSKSIKAKKKTLLGKTIKLGSYKQWYDGEEAPIEWRVIKTYKDGSVLAISEYILDYQKYNSDAKEGESTTWENSSIRKWLNEDFYNKAFNDEQKANIIKSQSVADNNPYYTTKSGNDTYDNVSLLNLTEMKNSKYFAHGEDHEGWYWSSKGTATAEATSYVYETNNYSDDVNTWWLLTAGEDGTKASFVGKKGGVDYSGDKVTEKCGIRPIIRVKVK